MSCYTCAHAAMFRQPKDRGECRIYGLCFKDGQDDKHGYPIYIPRGCKKESTQEEGEQG